MAYVVLIRHGKTKSNIEGRYPYDLQEPLAPEGIKETEELKKSCLLPAVTTVYSSPALRCMQTKEILFPGMDWKSCPLGEINFGIFSGKNWAELRDDQAYKMWLKSNCMGHIPGGESVADFINTCYNTFIYTVSEIEGRIALVIHGGSIMAILSRLALPKKDFHHYHLPNCGFFVCRYDGNALHIEERGGLK